MDMLSSLLKDLDLMSDDDIIELAMLHSDSTFYAEELVSNFNSYNNIFLSYFSPESRSMNLNIKEYHMKMIGIVEENNKINKNNIHDFYLIGKASMLDDRNTIQQELYSDLLSLKKYPSRMGVMKSFHTSLRSVKSICSMGLDSLLKAC